MAFWDRKRRQEKPAQTQEADKLAGSEEPDPLYDYRVFLDDPTEEELEEARRQPWFQEAMAQLHRELKEWQEKSKEADKLAGSEEPDPLFDNIKVPREDPTEEERRAMDNDPAFRKQSEQMDEESSTLQSSDRQEQQLDKLSRWEKPPCLYDYRVPLEDPTEEELEVVRRQPWFQEAMAQLHRELKEWRSKMEEGEQSSTPSEKTP